MIKFIDGPAAGEALALRRAPILLRVVSARAKHWDALDQPEDVAKPHETIYVYRLTAPATWIRICARGKDAKALRGLWWNGAYAFLPDQPLEDFLRDNTAWAAWCEANREQLMPEWNRVPAGGGQCANT